MKERKTYRLQVPMAANDKKRLEAISERMGMTKAAWVRWAIIQSMNQVEANK